MDFFLQDPDVIRLPPEQVRLVDLQITPHPNGRLVKVYIEVTPFTKRPNFELSIREAGGKEVSHTTVLEAMTPKNEFILHLRQPAPGTQCSLELVVYYQKFPEPADTPQEVPLPEPMIVDQRVETFSFPTQDT